jgi:hypothetical protein
MVGDVTNGYLSMKECLGVAWPGLLKVENVTKTVLEISKVYEEWHIPGLCEVGVCHIQSVEGTSQ